MHFCEFMEKSHVWDSKPELHTFCFQHWCEVRSIGDCQSINFTKFSDFLVNFQISWLFWSIFKFPDFSRFMATLSKYKKYLNFSMHLYVIIFSKYFAMHQWNINYIKSMQELFLKYNEGKTTLWAPINYQAYCILQFR